MATTIQFIGPALATTGGTDVEIFLRGEIPPSMKGSVWSCLVAGLAAGEQPAWDNAPSAERQMFLSTAAGIWLDRRAAGLGLERPADVGMPDEAFRDYAIQVSSRQQTIPAILEALRVFYGTAAVQAGVEAASENYILADGQTLVAIFDNVQAVTVTFRTADFANISQARAQEVAGVLNREFLMQGVNAEAIIASNTTTGLTFFTIYTGTLGARGSVQVAAGAAQAALGLPTTLARLLSQPRAAYVLTRGKRRVEVIFPATSNVVSRTVATAAYLSDYSSLYGDGVYGVGVYGGGPPPPGIGPYLFEGVSRGVAITGTSTSTTVTLTAAGQYRLVAVASTAGFPDTTGWVVFGYGFEYQSAPVKYLGTAGPTAILIDAAYTFAETVPSGAAVNLLVNEKPPIATLGEVGDFYLTDSPAGRVAAMATVDSIAAAGYEVIKTISYPGDAGLGYAGHPKHGVPDLSDIVQCFAGSNVDVEVATARSA